MPVSGETVKKSGAESKNKRGKNRDVRREAATLEAENNPGRISRGQEVPANAEYTKNNVSSKVPGLMFWLRCMVRDCA